MVTKTLKQEISDEIYVVIQPEKKSVTYDVYQFGEVVSTCTSPRPYHLRMEGDLTTRNCLLAIFNNYMIERHIERSQLTAMERRGLEEAIEIANEEGFRAPRNWNDSNGENRRKLRRALELFGYEKFAKMVK